MISTMLFKAGTWKGSAYTNEDLKSTAASYNDTKVSAPWTVGHEVLSGDPAAGWLRQVEYREDAEGVGELWGLSDFNQLGQKLLGDKTHENKSISFYPKNSQYSPDPSVNFIRHVALLGAEMPALTNLGPVALVDFSEDLPEEELLTYACSCKENSNNDEELTMSQFEMLKKMIEDLEAKLTPSPAELSEAEPAGVAVVAEPALYSEPEPTDYKQMYEDAVQELKALRQNSASTTLAQTVDSYYSDGILTEEIIPAKDLTLCLTKLEMGHADFTDSENPKTLIESLIQALKAAQPRLQIPMGEETSTESFTAEIELSSEDNNLGDDFAMAAEKIAVDHGLSFSQGMSALLSAQSFVAETGESLSSAVKREVNRFKINK